MLLAVVLAFAHICPALLIPFAVSSTQPDPAGISLFKSFINPPPYHEGVIGRLEGRLSNHDPGVVNPEAPRCTRLVH